MAKTAVFDPSKDATILRVGTISQSSAKQRAGRAGRTAPGVCHRLYSEADFDEMASDQPAELLRVDATAALLTIMRQIARHSEWIGTIRDFPFVEHPGTERLQRSLEMLWHLGAIDSLENLTLTPHGMAMARMKASAREAAIMFRAQQLGVANLAAVALGMLGSYGTLFRRGRADEEVAAAQGKRRAFAGMFPTLGDLGTAVAVWLGARHLKGAELAQWCREHSVSVRTLKGSMGTVRSLLFELSTTEAAMRTAKKETAKASNADDAEEGAAVGDVDDRALDTDDTTRGLEAVTEATLRDPDQILGLQQSLVAGYFGNFAYHLPRRDGAAGDSPPSYYLPRSNQVGVVGSRSVLRLAANGADTEPAAQLPEMCLFLEIVDSHCVYISTLLGIDDATFQACVPSSFRDSAAYSGYLAANTRRQMLARPSVAATNCGLALARLLQDRGGSAEALVALYTRQKGLAEGADLIVEVDRRRQQVGWYSWG